MHFLTVGNLGYLEFTKNVILNFQSSFLKHHQLHVACLDLSTTKTLSRWTRRKGFSNTVIRHHSQEIADYAKYGSLSFNEITRYKLDLIYEYAAKMGDIFYIDGDVVFYSDPEPSVQIKANKDLIFQAESLVDAYGTWQCTGCFFIRGNEHSLDFLQEIIRSYSTNIQQNDQEALQTFLKKRNLHDIRQLQRPSLDIFDILEFQNGALAVDLDWHKHPRCIAIHANYRIGKKAKITALIKCSGWFQFDYLSPLQWRSRIKLLKDNFTFFQKSNKAL